MCLGIVLSEDDQSSVSLPTHAHLENIQLVHQVCGVVQCALFTWTYIQFTAAIKQVNTYLDVYYNVLCSVLLFTLLRKT